jgi:hypothetical protein
MGTIHDLLVGLAARRRLPSGVEHDPGGRLHQFLGCPNRQQLVVVANGSLESVEAVFDGRPGGVLKPIRPLQLQIHVFILGTTEYQHALARLGVGEV